MLKSRHLPDPTDFSPEKLNEVFDFAEQIVRSPGQFNHLCDSSTLATFFYEPSPGTRFSFEAAALSLGSNAAGFFEPTSSSVGKDCGTMAPDIKSLLIHGAHVVGSAHDGTMDILIQGGVITAVGRGLSSDGAAVIEAGGLTCLPALCDLHAHFRDPGQTQKEDLGSGSRAAVRGGYTAVNLMANTKPVISTYAQVNDVLTRARDIGLIDVHQCASITRDMDGQAVDHLETLGHAVRIISEDGRDVMDSHVMLQAMTAASHLDLTVMCHCEDMNLSGTDYRLAEDLMTHRNIELARAASCRLHIAHVSTEGSMRAVIAAKERRQAVTCEVTPHHLALTSATHYRVNPPLRTQQDVDFLICAVQQGWVDAIATDHAPHTADDKAAGAPGMVGLETAFGVCYTTLVLPGHITLARLTELMSQNPARILGLNKGFVAPGYDGDLVLVDPQAPWTVDATAFASKGHNTPFDGQRLVGRVVMTIKAGRIVYDATATNQEERQ